MIAHLRGVLLEKHPNQVIVEAGGVGYDVLIPVSTFSALPEAGSEVRLRIHTHVRRTRSSLFGFFTAEEKSIFEKLISVSGIGPSLAVKFSPDGNRRSDSSHPQRIGGVVGPHPRRGKKNRRAHSAGTERQTGGDRRHGARAERPASALSTLDQDVLSALLNLGCQRPAAEAAVRKAKADGRSGRIRTALPRALD